MDKKYCVSASFCIQNQLIEYRKLAYKYFLKNKNLFYKDIWKFFNIDFDIPKSYFLVPVYFPFKSLDKNSWIADIRYAYNFDDLKIILDKIFNKSNDNLLQLYISAFYTHAKVIFIPPEVKIDKPIIIQDEYWNNQVIEKIIIIAKKNSSISLNLVSAENKKITIQDIIGIVEPNAKVTLLTDDNFSLSSMVIKNQSWYLYEKSEFVQFHIVSSACNSIFNFNYHLLGKNSKILHRSMTINETGSKTLFSTVQNHMMPESESSIKLKNLMFGNSNLYYKGLIEVDKESRKIFAEQNQVALMMDNQAHSYSLPSFKVKTNEVRCKHGAACGYLNWANIWYLKSRGFDERQAKLLLINGFFNDIINELPNLKLNINLIFQKYIHRLKNSYLNI